MPDADTEQNEVVFPTQLREEQMVPITVTMNVMVPVSCAAMPPDFWISYKIRPYTYVYKGQTSLVHGENGLFAVEPEHIENLVMPLTVPISPEPNLTLEEAGDLVNIDAVKKSKPRRRNDIRQPRSTVNEDVIREPAPRIISVRSKYWPPGYLLNLDTKEWIPKPDDGTSAIMLPKKHPQEKPAALSRELPTPRQSMAPNKCELPVPDEKPAARKRKAALVPEEKKNTSPVNVSGGNVNPATIELVVIPTSIVTAQQPGCPIVNNPFQRGAVPPPPAAPTTNRYVPVPRAVAPGIVGSVASTSITCPRTVVPVPDSYQHNSLSSLNLSELTPGVLPESVDVYSQDVVAPSSMNVSEYKDVEMQTRDNKIQEECLVTVATSETPLWQSTIDVASTPGVNERAKTLPLIASSSSGKHGDKSKGSTGVIRTVDMGTTNRPASIEHRNFMQSVPSTRHSIISRPPITSTTATNSPGSGIKDGQVMLTTPPKRYVSDSPVVSPTGTPPFAKMGPATIRYTHSRPLQTTGVPSQWERLPTYGKSPSDRQNTPEQHDSRSTTPVQTKSISKLEASPGMNRESPQDTEKYEWDAKKFAQLRENPMERYENAVTKMDSSIKDAIKKNLLPNTVNKKVPHYQMTDICFPCKVGYTDKEKGRNLYMIEGPMSPLVKEYISEHTNITIWLELTKILAENNQVQLIRIFIRETLSQNGDPEMELKYMTPILNYANGGSMYDVRDMFMELLFKEYIYEIVFRTAMLLDLFDNDDEDEEVEDNKKTNTEGEDEKNESIGEEGNEKEDVAVDKAEIFWRALIAELREDPLKSYNNMVNNLRQAIEAEINDGTLTEDILTCIPSMNMSDLLFRTETFNEDEYISAMKVDFATDKSQSELMDYLMKTWSLNRLVNLTKKLMAAGKKELLHQFIHWMANIDQSYDDEEVEEWMTSLYDAADDDNQLRTVFEEIIYVKYLPQIICHIANINHESENVQNITSEWENWYVAYNIEFIYKNVNDVYTPDENMEDI